MHLACLLALLSAHTPILCQTHRSSVGGSGIVNGIPKDNGLTFWDVEQRRGEADYNLAIGLYGERFDNTNGLQYALAEFQYGRLVSDPQRFRTYDISINNAVPTELELLFVKDVMSTWCNPEIHGFCYLSGSGGSNRGSVLYAKLPPNGTTVLSVYKDDGTVGASWAFDIGASDLEQVCSHEFAIDRYGHREPFHTTYNYVIPANGLYNVPATQTDPDPPLYKGVLWGSINQPGNDPAPVAPIVKSYAVTDASNKLYTTRFLHAIIDESVSESIPQEKAKLLMTPAIWDVYVVGDKKYNGRRFPLAASFDTQLANILTCIYDLTIEGGSSFHFEQIIDCHDATGTKAGHLVAGITHDVPLPVTGTDGSSLFIAQLEGAGLHLNTWHFVYRAVSPDIFWSHIEDLRELEDRSIVVLIRNSQHPTAYTTPPTPHSPWSILHLNSDGSVRAAWTSRQLVSEEAVNELVPTLDAATSELVTSVYGEVIYNAISHSSTSNSNTCFVRDLLVTTVQHTVERIPHGMEEFPEQAVAIDVQRTPIPSVEEVLCTLEVSPCTTESGTVQLWGSHYDRGNDIAVYGQGLISTGLSAGAYHLVKTQGVECYDECSDRADPQSTNNLAQRGMDCHIIYSDDEFKFSSTEHGWYRLLTDAVDVVVQCPANEQTGYTVKGNPSFDVGYDIGSKDDIIHVSGVTINRTDANGFSCWGTDLCNTGYDVGVAGDFNSILFEVRDLGTVTQEARALLFGKRHNDVESSIGKFQIVDNFYNLHDLDESATATSNAKAHVKSAEIFYAHSTISVPELSFMSEMLTTCVGLTTTSSYQLAGTPPAPVADPPIVGKSTKRGLLFATTSLLGVESCNTLEMVWAKTVSSTLSYDKGVGFADVAAINSQAGIHEFVAVGYAQGGNGRFLQNDNTWEDLPAGGTGVLVKYTHNGAILKCARVGLSSSNCNSFNPIYDGFVRLVAIASFPYSESLSRPSNIVVVGSCNSIADGSNDNKNNEQILVACYSSELELLWYRIVRPVQIENEWKYNGRARTVSIRDDGVIAVGGDMAYEDASRKTKSDMFVVELDQSGSILSGAIVVAQSNCDYFDEENNHLESIVVTDNGYAVIGSSCDFLQPPFNLSTQSWCGNRCLAQKGDIIGVTWNCTQNIPSGRTLTFGYYGTNGIAHEFDLTWSKSLSLTSRASSDPGDVELAIAAIEDVCHYVSLKSVEIAKNSVHDEHDPDGCPDDTKPESDYEAGTYHGTSQIPLDCWP